MSSGELRERISFEYRAATDDGYGNPISGDWTEGYRTAARIQPLRGGEGVQAARLEGRQPFILKIRVSALALTITTDWRAHNTRTGEVYEIRSHANTDEKRKYLELLCEFIGQIEPFGTGDESNPVPIIF